MQPDRIEALADLPDAAPVVLHALADAMQPMRRLSVAEWAEDQRIVPAESGTRYPGPWRNDRAPHLVEIMHALGPEDAAEDVVFVKSAQVGGSEVGINFFGWAVCQDPGPMITVLPSHDESLKYVRTKMQPAIDESPALRSRVLEMQSRGERGSTASYKRFRGGFNQVTFAGSSKGLQMLTARYTLGDEVSEWPAEAGDRGDPVAQLKKRTETYERDRKRFWVSTPALLGSCRITRMYQDSDRRRRYVPCPHCGTYQVLRFERLKWESDTWPHKAWFECAANGCVIEGLNKNDMLDQGLFIATAGDDGPAEVIAPDDLDMWRDRHLPGRVRGFHIWKAYSKMVTWDSIVSEYLDAKDSHERLRVFTQQVLGEAWEDKGDAPDSDKLFTARVPSIRKGLPPVGPVVFTGATDVQGNRLEWAVYGWSEGMTRWLVDWGVIEGDPLDESTWARHDDMVTSRSYAPGGGNPQPVRAWAVDAGYVSQAVYNYARGRPGIYAVDGRHGRTEPMIGAPRKVDVKWNGKRMPKGAVLWPVGTFALKADLYSAIRKAILGPDEAGEWRRGAVILPGDVSLAYSEQLTSEHLRVVEKANGIREHRWEKLQGRPNEALDIAGYARAMAYHLQLDRLTDEEWQRLRMDLIGTVEETPQGDLFAGPVAAPDAPEAPKPPAKPVQQQTAPSSDWLGGRGDAWL